jgi:hypothetical protein
VTSPLSLHGKSTQLLLDGPDNLEQRIVLARLAGDLLEEELAGLLSSLPASPLLRALAAAVEEHVEECLIEGREVLTADTADLYVRDALFPTAIRAAQTRLARKCNGEGSVSWGNTNARASDFECALKQAAGGRRPVFFLKWGAQLRGEEEELL